MSPDLSAASVVHRKRRPPPWTSLSAPRTQKFRYAQAASHAGQTTLYLTSMHGKTAILKSLIANIHAALRHIRLTAEQFKQTDPWTTLMRYVSDKIAPTLGPFRPPDAMPATG